MRTLIASTFTPFSHDMDRKVAEALRRELQARGHEAELTLIPLRQGPGELPAQLLAMRLLDLTESNQNQVDLLVTIGFPASILAHPRKIAWILDPYPKANPCSPHSNPNGDSIRDVHLHNVARRFIRNGLARCSRIYAANRYARESLDYDLQVPVTGLLPSPFHAGGQESPGTALGWDAIVPELTA